MKTSGLFSRIILVFVFLFLYAPILVLIFFSFNASNSQTAFSGFSLRWYVDLFSDSSILIALKNTLIVGVVSAALATVIGTFAAVGIFCMKNKPKELIMNITYLPVLNPDILTAISMMLVFQMLSLEFGLLTLIIAHTTFNIPYVILSVMPKLRQLNMSEYEAALDLGAKPFTALRKVVYPSIKPGIVTGLIMAFTMSIDDFIISYFTKGTGVQTLPIVIYSMTKRKVTPKINALSTLMFVVVLVLLIIVNLRQDRTKKTVRAEKRL